MKTTHQKHDLGGGYSVTITSDPDGGLPVYSYYYKRIKLRHKILESGPARQLAGYSMISFDLKKVREWLEEIGSWQKENGEPRLFQHFPKQMNLATCPRVISGLYVAALTIYGKCFTSAKGRRVKLEKRIFDDHKSNPAQFLSSHEHIMHLRHNLAAHSGTTSLEGTEVVFTLAPKSKRKVWPKVFAISMQVQAIVSSGMETSDDDPSFSKLVEYVDSWVNYKTNLLKKRIWVEEVEKNVREEYGADPDMLARVKMVEAEWEMPDP